MKEPSVFVQPRDGVEIARGVARDIRELLGQRVERVLLYGSWARGEGRVDSDVDILVVVSEVDPRDNRLFGPLSELSGDWFLVGGRPVSIRVVTQKEIDDAIEVHRPTVRQMFIRTAASEATPVPDGP